MDTHVCSALENEQSWCLQGLPRVFLGKAKHLLFMAQCTQILCTWFGFSYGYVHVHSFGESVSSCQNRRIFRDRSQKTKIPKPISQETKHILRYGPQKPKTPKIQSYSKDHFSRQSPKNQNTKAHRPRNEHNSSRRSRKKQKAKDSKPLGVSREMAFGIGLNL